MPEEMQLPVLISKGEPQFGVTNRDCASDSQLRWFDLHLHRDGYALVQKLHDANPGLLMYAIAQYASVQHAIGL